MSKNEIVTLLRQIKYESVSKADIKFNKIFKEYNIDSLLDQDKFANQVRKKWLYEEDDNSKYKIKTTNDKLKQIIKTNKNAAKIQDIFFKTFDKEPIFKKIINKENEKDKNINKVNSNKISEKIKHLTENRKKVNITNTFLKKRQELKNRSPPLCLYTPKYSYIYKHVPGFNFHNERTTSKKKILLNSNDNYKLNQIKDSKNNSVLSENIKSKNNKLINSKSYKIIKNSLTPLNISSKRGHISFVNEDNNNNEGNNLYEEKKNYLPFNKNQNNFFLSQQCSPVNSEIENKIQFDYSPKLIEKNKLVPNFDKMMPRFLDKPKVSKKLSNADYSPNYNAIFSGVLNNNPIDYEKRKKYYNLKKIITIHNPTSEYLLFPQLNNKD